MKNEVVALNFNVREWSAAAGLPWQSVYRKLSNPRTLLLDEYDRLAGALDKLKAAKKREFEPIQVTDLATEYKPRGRK